MTAEKLPDSFDKFIKAAPSDITQIVVESRENRDREIGDPEFTYFIYGERKNGESYYFCDARLSYMTVDAHAAAIAELLKVPLFDPNFDPDFPDD